MSPRRHHPSGTLALLLALEVTALAGQEPQTELLARLQNAASPVDQANLCAQLRAVAGPEAVPLLAPLLQHPSVAHAALYALETLPGPEATDALHTALVQTTSAVRVAVVHSLGWRGDPGSVRHLVPLLEQADPTLVSATALALARIASEEAEAALLTVWDHRKKSEAARLLAPALLLLAEKHRLENRFAQATRLFTCLLSPGLPNELRRAAWMGRLRVAGDHLLPQAENLLRGSDPDGVAAVLALWPEWPVPLRTELALRALPRLAPVPQAAVLAHLSDGAEPRLAPLVREQIHHPHPAVRLAALRALATVGDATDVAALVQAASQGAEPERDAARRSLIHLAGPKVADALVDQLIRAPPDSQAEILNILSARHETRAVPHLTELLRTGAAPARLTALRALVELAGPESFGPLLRLVSEPQDLESQRQLVEFFHRWLERLAGQPLDTAPLAEALDTATDSNRAALFEIAARVSEQRIRTAIQRALKSTEPTQRQAALQTLCQTQDPELLPDILQQCEKAGDPRLRARLFESAARLLADLPQSEPLDGGRLAVLLHWASLADTTPSRRLCLSVLTQFPHPETLARVEQIRQLDPDVRAEAELAGVRIAAALADSWAPAETLLEHLTTNAAQPAIQAEARTRLQLLHSGWQVAGPYRVAGRQGPDLFNEVFPPENPAATHVAWRTVPAVAPDQPGHLDLSNLSPGDHCVLYARTHVFSPVEQSVRLKIGSDDGIKLWINGELVHAHNTVRGLAPGQDQAQARLSAGWNHVLVKLTQHTAGCGVWIEIALPEGTSVPGLLWDPRGQRRPTP